MLQNVFVYVYVCVGVLGTEGILRVTIWVLTTVILGMVRRLRTAA
jgi:hypothetical protein